MKDRDLLIAAAAAAGVTVAGCYLICDARRPAAQAAGTLAYYPHYNVVVFSDDGTGASVTGILIKHPKQAPISELQGSVERALGLSNARLFVQVLRGMLAILYTQSISLKWADYGQLSGHNPGQSALSHPLETTSTPHLNPDRPPRRSCSPWMRWSPSPTAGHRWCP